LDQVQAFGATINCIVNCVHPQNCKLQNCKLAVRGKPFYGWRLNI
jgi:hypothetical protein